MKLVKFTRQWDIYNSGETAGFPKHVADALTDGDDPPAIEVVTAEAKAVVTSTSRSSAKKAAVRKRKPRKKARKTDEEE